MNNFLCNDYSENSLFVQCDCGDEILEISPHGVTDGYVSFYTHSWFDKKKCRYCDFDLSISDFHDMTFRLLLSDSDYVYYNRSKYKGTPKILRLTVGDGFISFSLYKNMKHLKKNIVVWEVIIGYGRLKELKTHFDRLECFVNSKLCGKENDE